MAYGKSNGHVIKIQDSGLAEVCNLSSAFSGSVFVVYVVEYLICCLCRCGKSERGESSTERYYAMQSLHGQRYFDVVFALQSHSVLWHLCSDRPRLSYLSNCNTWHCPDVHIMNTHATLYIKLLQVNTHVRLPR